MQTTTTIAEDVFHHHIGSLGNNDLEELMKDYTEQSELWTPNGAIVGLEAISSFYSYAFTLFPKGKTSFDIQKLIADDDKVYIVWTADSSVVNVSFGTDSFYIRDGKILWQSTAFQMTQK
jgi:hypothetical protein